MQRNLRLARKEAKDAYLLHLNDNKCTKNSRHFLYVSPTSSTQSQFYFRPISLSATNQNVFRLVNTVEYQ